MNKNGFGFNGAHSVSGTGKGRVKAFAAAWMALVLICVCLAGGCATSNGRTGESTPEGGATDAQTEVTPAPATPTQEPEPTIERTLGPGQYFAENGVIFAPEGYTSSEGSRFTFKKGFSAAIIDYTGKAFNRITFRYTSTKPLKLNIKYNVGGKAVDDRFYLEAGENMTFHGLILGYLNGDTADSIDSIAIDSLKSSTDFSLLELSTSRVDVHNDKSYFIRNDRFKVGIRLNWGGGINYIEDLTAKVSGLTNLINSHDTGRLVQQSYYGGADASYTPGTFNGSTWPYNPVQGGDQYGNSSRLIDIEIGANYVYIKSQPQDWAQNNLITPSYMENRYTVEKDYIRVDNRFVDFSGYPHGQSNQELPAFYTVSYLDCFSWYNGVNSWTDESLAHRASLNFWGDQKYADSCRFHMKGDNTETWCAWTNRGDDFGIGLYVPNIDLFYAGRYKYNGSKDASNDATNYVAPLLTLKLPNYTALEYSYLITTGSLDNIRATFKANKDFVTNESLHKNYTPERDIYADYTNLDFSKKDNSYALEAANNAVVTYSSSAKALKLRVKGGTDPQTTLNFLDFAPEQTAEKFTKLTIEYMIPTSNAKSSYSCDFFLCTGEKTAPDGSEMVRCELICDGDYHTLEVDLSALSFWKGKINLIRFDFFDDCSSGDVMNLRSFKLS
ncbi:MAG: hypothetical protein J5950_00080 [Clostridia bacterium]|nr:hypothetical protein [Clostridia bacterium]